MSKILLSIFLALLPGYLFASHLSGGEITYKFNGTNYTISCVMFLDCTGAAPPTSAGVVAKSVSQNLTYQLTASLVSSNVFSMACAGQQNTCQNLSSPVPGFKVHEYAVTTALPPANDWVISFSISARNPSNNIVAGNFYVESTLDNSSNINSSPVVTGKPYFFITANNTTSIPLQYADYEGDSVAYELVSPLAAAGTSVGYLPGYSVSAPFGASGSCSINNSTKMLTVLAPNIGYYTIAIKVKEYRNGNLVGTYIRDANILVTNGSMTVDFPVSTSTFKTTTCPGLTNNVTVNFTDAGNDSVFLTVTTPTITGFTFNSSTTSAAGSGSASFSWTTPPNFNPATMPYFTVGLYAEDNDCPKAKMDYTFIVYTKQCASDSVWPGDANGDYTVNIYDPLAIAIAAGQTGAARTSPTTNWVAQHCTNWTNSFVTTNVNMKHADCDGNGTVNTTDLGAVTANWGLTHPKGEHQNKVTGAPPLYFDLTGIQLKPGTAVSIPIKLGDAGNAMNDIYGLATRIAVNNITMGSPSVKTTTSWLGTSANTLNFTKVSPSVVHWSHARTDHQVATGNGTIGHLEFIVPANAQGGTNVTFSFSMTKMIDADGEEITNFDEQNATAMIPFPENISNVTQNVSYMAIVPNPSATSAALRFALEKAAVMEVRVIDVIGKQQWEYKANHEAGDNSIDLPAGRLASGIYTIQVKEGNKTTQMKWNKL